EILRVCWNPACRVEFGELQQATFTMEDVIDTVRSGAPLAPGQIETLETSTNHDRATAAGVVALRQYPAQHRARLQALILRYLSAEARECVTTLDLTESRFGFDPRLVTLNEINGESGTESAAAAARVFPPLRVNELPVPNHPERTFELRAMWPYWHVEYGQHLWQAIKDWGHGMRSGSEVHQSLLSFVALVLAGNALSETDQPGFAIVPAPSNTMSARQPGQCSLRLGQRVAEILECEFINALEKRRGGRIAVRRDPQHDLTGRTVILVDDQVTDGNTMNGCVKALVEAGAEVVRVLTWSSSHETTEPTTSSCWLRRHHLPCDEHDGQTLF
ncbi:MAG: phosphoribosyltransferase family protein, partial [Longimicrobiales bacterium]|nr:phosphoribosyltransferase family protein [Longimicrobiales bacterium]